MIQKIIYFIVLSSIFQGLYSQNVTIMGTISDSVTGEGLPYAALIFKGTTTGTSTDENGHFTLSAPRGKKILSVSYLGYETQEIEMIPEKTPSLNILLKPIGISLEEVTVRPKREKYRKKDNPAVRFVKAMIERRKENNPRDHEYFSYNRYEKVIFAMNEYTPKPSQEGKKGKFNFLTEYVDTLNNGTTILPISEKEKISTIYYRKKSKM